MEIYEIIRLVCEIILLILYVFLAIKSKNNKSILDDKTKELIKNKIINILKQQIPIFMAETENIKNITNKQRKEMAMSRAEKLIELTIKEFGQYNILEIFDSDYKLDIDNFIEYVIDIKNKFKKK